MKPVRRWHIFCRVIDNYGDIGVCWRLARQLHREHGQKVTLWVDDLASFHAIWPAVDATAAEQYCEGVSLRLWSDPFPANVAVADVVIEAFACELPASYLEAMVPHQPTWINLEYLSAEEWVRDYHLRPSPVHGLRKTFFFPGFEAGTGGLLWDTDAPEPDRSPQARQQLLQRWGVIDSAPDALLISLFAYTNPALPGLLQALADGSRTAVVLVPAGPMLAGAEQWLGSALAVGEPRRRGGLTLAALPFMPQPDYDQLLVQADLNLVRGEDSFVRSQVLGVPFVWHIYPQDEDAHRNKLEAFLNLFLDGADEALDTAVRRAHEHWNGFDDAAPWPELLDQLPALTAHCRQWRTRIIGLGDLASNIVRFSAVQV